MINHYAHLWVEKYRPKTLDDILLPKDIKDYFTSLTDDVPHLLFYGPPGTGKSSLAKIIVKSILKCQYLYINASDENGVDTIRNKVISFAQTRSIDDKKKIIILEEADGLTGDSLRILRNVTEEYSDSTRFILTANYYNRIIEPIRSRCVLFKILPDLKDVVQRCVDILKTEKISVSQSSKNEVLGLIEKQYPDMRRIINDLQKFSVTGTLQIVDRNQISNFSEYLIKTLLSKGSVLDLRKKVIEMEKSFNKDYQHLLKEMFDYVFSSEIQENVKKLVLLELGESLYRTNFVLDQEINFFCCLLSLENCFKN